MKLRHDDVTSVCKCCSPRRNLSFRASDTGRRRGASGANTVAHKSPLSNSVSIDEWNGRMQASTRGFTCERVEAAILTSVEPLHLIVSLLESRSRIAARASRDFHSPARAAAALQ